MIFVYIYIYIYIYILFQVTLQRVTCISRFLHLWKTIYEETATVFLPGVWDPYSLFSNFYIVTQVSFLLLRSETGNETKRIGGETFD